MKRPQELVHRVTGGLLQIFGSRDPREVDEGGNEEEERAKKDAVKGSVKFDSPEADFPSLGQSEGDLV